MNEEEFKRLLQEHLQKEIRNCEITINENLIYRVIINEQLVYDPEDPRDPRRGKLAFQTDLIVKKNDLPLVVVETKLRRFTTHDVMVYSTKALKHKEIYPHLRYGLVVGNLKAITNKFFIHNLGFDFALAIEDISNLETFVKIIKAQIRNSKKLLRLLREQNRTRLFSSNLVIEYD